MAKAVTVPHRIIRVIDPCEEETFDCYVSPAEYDKIQTFYDSVTLTRPHHRHVCMLTVHRPYGGGSEFSACDVEIPEFQEFYIDGTTTVGDPSNVGLCTHAITFTPPIILIGQCTNTSCDCRDTPGRRW